MLLCFLAHSQEAENLGSYAEVSIIPRLDLNPYYSSEDSKLGFTHGNSSVYTLFEGSVGEHFSWTLANHWISSLNVPASDEFNYAWPYKYLGYSDCTNWIDYCKVDLTFGNWAFTLGKDCLSTLGFEYEDWDWDVHFDLTTPFWNAVAAYQWGAKVAYTVADATTFSLQMTSSPYGEHPFASGLWAYSFQWRGEYGWFEPIWSYSAFQFDKSNGAFQNIVSLGNKFNFSDEFNFVLDWTGSFVKSEWQSEYSSFNQFRGVFTYAPSDRFDIALHGIFYKAFEADLESRLGVVAQFYPLKDSQDLRLHAGFTYFISEKVPSLTVGARYDIRIKCW